MTGPAGFDVCYSKNSHNMSWGDMLVTDWPMKSTGDS